VPGKKEHEGLFEVLATAVLQEDNPRYASLVHSGVNAAGKTVKAPLDGICFVSGADPPHLIGSGIGHGFQQS
jgi:hypothetical protein